MQDHNGLPGDGTVGKNEAPPIWTNTMFQVLPVAQRVDCLVLTDLGVTVGEGKWEVG